MPWAKVFDNVWLPLKLAGVSRDAAAPVIQQVLEMVGLSRFADVYPRELSGGMKQRVAIARALVTQPRLLLMDEPFAALDEITRHRLQDDLLALWRRTGATVVFVTHSIYEAAFLARRVAVMTPRPGRIARLIDSPLDPAAENRLAPAYTGFVAAITDTLRATATNGAAGG